MLGTVSAMGQPAIGETVMQKHVFEDEMIVVISELVAVLRKFGSLD